MRQQKMDSREMGLVLGQQLFGIQDLHYGLWDDDLELSLTNLPLAQQRYTEMLLSALPPVDGRKMRLLDIGCGTGHLLGQCLDRGYLVDGISPSPSLSKLVKQRLAEHPGNKTRLFECRLEAFPVAEFRQYYDVALFSESFQYIPMQTAFDVLQCILKPGGRVVICDFFQTEAAGDGLAGDGSFGGGHRMKAFYQLLDNIPFDLKRDDDITSQVSPNLELLNDLLMNRLRPASRTVGTWLHGRHPLIYRLVTRLFRKRLDKIRYKYFAGHRNKETFERYKTYHLLVLELRDE